MFIGKRKREKKDKDEEDPILPEIKIGGGKEEPETELNHIYFYDDVSTENSLTLNRKILAMEQKLLKHQIDYNLPEPPKIYLHLQTYGGSLHAGFSSADVIKNCRVPIVVIVEGVCASAGTIMTVVAHEKYMTESSYMLIHQLSSGSYGKYHELLDDFENNKNLMKRIIEIYRKNTKMKKKEIKKALKKDLWWDLSTCVEKGLIDGIWRNSEGELIEIKKKKKKQKKDE